MVNDCAVVSRFTPRGSYSALNDIIFSLISVERVLESLVQTIMSKFTLDPLPP